MSNGSINNVIVVRFYRLKIERYGYKLLKNFLDELYQKNMDESYKLNKKSMDILNKIKETDKFVELLDEKNDPNFEIFTPREVNQKNKEQIKTLKEQKKELQEQYESILDQIKSVSEQSKQIRAVIEENNRTEYEQRILKQRYTYEKKRLDQITAYVSREIEKENHTQEDISEEQKQSGQIQIVPEYQQLRNKLELVLGIFDLDRYRSKMELKQIKNILDKLAEKDTLSDHIQSEVTQITDDNTITEKSKTDLENSNSPEYQISAENESDTLQNESMDCVVIYDKAFDTGIESWMSGDKRILFDYMLDRIIHSLVNDTDQISVQSSEEQKVTLECTVEQENEETLIQHVKKENNTLLNILLDVTIEIEKKQDSSLVIKIEKVKEN